MMVAAGDSGDVLIKLTKFRNNKGLLSKTAKLVKVPNSNPSVLSDLNSNLNSDPVGNDGEDCRYQLEREGAGKLYDGTWETISVLWKDFGNLLDEVRHDEALCLGLWKGLGYATDGNNVGIVTKGTRTKTNFDWSKTGERLVLFDFDGIQEGETIQDLVDALGLPPGSELWVRGSASSGLRSVLHISSVQDTTKPEPHINIEGGHGNDEPSSDRDLALGPTLPVASSNCTSTGRCPGPGTGLKGLHAYYLWKESDWLALGADTEARFKAWLSGIREHLWSQDLGEYVVSNGSWPRLLERHIIDFAVFSPERLIYAGGTKGIENELGRVWQEREPAQLVKAGAGSGFVVPFGNGSDVSERNKISARGHVADELARREREAELSIINGDSHGKDGGQDGDCGCGYGHSAVRAYKRGLVPGSSELLMDSGERVKVWKVKMGVAEGLSFRGQGCRDPFDWDYDGGRKGKAYVFEDGSGVWSHAHGGQLFRFELDFESWKEIVSVMSKKELEQCGARLAEGSEEEGGGVGGDDDAWLGAIEGSEGLTINEKDAVFAKIKERPELGFVKVSDIRKKARGAVAGQGASEKLKRLQEMNDKYALIPFGSGGQMRVVWLESGAGGGEGRGLIIQKTEDWLKLVANEKIFVRDEKGEMKSIKLGVAWLEWKGRREYRGVVFKPYGGVNGDEERVRLECEKAGLWNMFQGFAVARDSSRRCGYRVEEGRGAEGGDCLTCDGRGCEGLSGCFTWSRHIREVLVANEPPELQEGIWNWIIDWFADIVQDPGKKKGTALVLYGEQRAGKGTTYQGLMKILGQQLVYQTADMTDITGKFNAFMEMCLFCFADEATWSKGHDASTKLKNLISEDNKGIERKGIDKYYAESFMRLGVSTNRDRAVPAEPGDGRYCILDVGFGKRGDAAWFNRIHGLNAGRLLDLLLRREIKSDLRTNPKTQALGEQQRIHVEEKVEVAWIIWLIEDGRLWDDVGLGVETSPKEMQNWYDTEFAGFKHDGRVALSYDQVAKRLGRLLSKAGVETETRVRKDSQRRSFKTKVWKPKQEVLACLGRYLGFDLRFEAGNRVERKD